MWQQFLTDRATEYLRFFIRAIMLTIGISFGIAATYVSVKAFWFGVDYLDHTVFANPWW